jgi:RNA polymerase sigma-70 factor, ECF subfamily
METQPQPGYLQETALASTSLSPLECVDDERDEAQMIIAVLNGQAGVFAELVRPYEPVLFRVAFAMLRNQADAEDVTQETLLRAFRKLQSFRSEARFSTWLMSIAMNEARGQLRRRKGRPLAHEESSHDRLAKSPELVVRDERESPFDRMARAELGARLHGAISKLPPAYKTVLQLRILDEQSIRTTAQILRWSEGAVKVRLHRARRLLRRQLKIDSSAVGRTANQSAQILREDFSRKILTSHALNPSEGCL